MSSVERLAREILDARRLALGHATSPQLGASALDGGRIDFRDADGNPIGGIGLGDGGVFEIDYSGGPKPPQPTPPVVTADGGIFRVDWDGSFASNIDDEGELATADLDRVEVHASMDENFVPDRVESFAGAYSSLDGGAFTFGPLPEAGTYYFRLVARSKSAQYSVPSDRVEQELAISSVDLEITDAWLTGEAAQNTADGKNSIFRGPDEPEPDPDNPFKDGDIWFEMTDDGKSIPNIWDETAGAWVANDDYRQSEIERVQDELRQELDDIVIDGSGTKNFYQSDEPTEGMREGDLWFDVSDQNKPYIYQGGEWVSVRDSYIEDGSVTTDKIAAGAITAESGIIGSINAGTITVGEMDGARIKANTIAADRILVGTGGNLAPWDQVRRGETVAPHVTFNGDEDGTISVGAEDTSRGVPAHMVHTRTSSQTGKYGPILMAGPEQRILGEPGRSYTVTFKVYSDDMTCAISPRLYWYTSSGDYVSSTYAPTAMRFNLSSTPQQVSFTAVMPDEASQMAPMIATSGDIEDRIGDIHIVDWQLKETIGATLIEGGAISTEHIRTGAITAESGIIRSIDANVITVGKIMGNQLDADAINGKTITGATIRTASSGSRVELTHNGLKQYNSLGATIVDMTAGSFTLEGGSITGSTIKTASSGSRVEITTQGLKQFNADNDVIAEMIDGSLVMKGILEQENSVAKMQVGTAFASTVSPGVAWFDIAGTGKYAGIAAQGGSSGNASVVVQGPRSTSTGGDAPYGYLSVTEGSSVLTYRANGDNGQSNFLRLDSSGPYLSGTADSGYNQRFYMRDRQIWTGWRNSNGTIGASLYLDNDGIGFYVNAASRRLLLNAKNIRIPDLPGDSGAVPIGRKSGRLHYISSARRFKLLEEPITDTVDSFEDRLLSVDAKTWIDKTRADRIADYETAIALGEEPEEDLSGCGGLERIPGVVAEDLEAAGLDVFVTYNDDGETESVLYDRIGPALIPIIRKQRDRIRSLEERVEALESRLDN